MAGKVSLVSSALDSVKRLASMVNTTKVGDSLAGSIKTSRPLTPREQPLPASPIRRLADMTSKGVQPLRRVFSPVASSAFVDPTRRLANMVSKGAKPPQSYRTSTSIKQLGRRGTQESASGISIGNSNYELGAGGTPPSITMPKPSKPRTGLAGRAPQPQVAPRYQPKINMPLATVATAKSASGGGASMNYLAGAGLTAMGAAVGGTASYATGGNFSDGAVYGALAGGSIMGLSHLSRTMGGAAALGTSGMGGWTGSAVGALKGFENPANRAYAMGAGAALGGFAFGGRKNSARGFNKDRGNRIGR